MSEEVEFWKQQVLTRNRDQLATVSKAATAWSALFTAVLGVFSTAAFAGGLTAVDRLEGPWAGVVKGATLLAVLLALAATVFAGLASGASASVTNDSTWDGQRDWVKSQATRAFERLQLAKRFGVAAGSVVLLGSAGVLLAGEADPQAPTVVVVVGGRALCGPLTTTGNGLAVGGTALTTVTSLTVVEACP